MTREALNCSKNNNSHLVHGRHLAVCKDLQHTKQKTFLSKMSMLIIGDAMAHYELRGIVVHVKIAMLTFGEAFLL